MEAAHPAEHAVLEELARLQQHGVGGVDERDPVRDARRLRLARQVRRLVEIAGERLLAENRDAAVHRHHRDGIVHRVGKHRRHEGDALLLRQLRLVAQEVAVGPIHVADAEAERLLAVVRGLARRAKGATGNPQPSGLLDCLPVDGPHERGQATADHGDFLLHLRHDTLSEGVT